MIKLFQKLQFKKINKNSNLLIPNKKFWIDEENALSKIESENLNPQIKRYILEIYNQGYTIIKGVHSKDFCKQAIEDYKEFLQKNNKGLIEKSLNKDTGQRIINLHLCLAILSKLFENDKLPLQIQDILFESETCLYTSLYFDKGSQQPLHRDVPYFFTVPYKFYFGVWHALENVDSENGPLLIVPFSHKLPEIDRIQIRNKYFKLQDKIPSTNVNLWDDYQNAIMKQIEGKGLKTIEAHMEAGDVIIWHPLTMHGGKEILDPTRTRHSWVCHTTPLNVPVYQQEYFFKPEIEPPTKPSWRYREFAGNRKMVEGDFLDINHRLKVPISDLNL